jgi:hypothetical protein
MVAFMKKQEKHRWKTERMERSGSAGWRQGSPLPSPSPAEA